MQADPFTSKRQSGASRADAQQLDCWAWTRTTVQRIFQFHHQRPHQALKMMAPDAA